MGAFLALIGAWLIDLAYLAPFRKVVEGAKEISIHEQLCFLASIIFTMGILFLLMPQKMMAWGKRLEEQKKNRKISIKDYLVIALMIAPGIAGYFYLKSEIEARGFTFR